MPAGERPTDPTAVLGNERLAEVFDQLRQTFDIVLLDSPPVLLFTDAIIRAQVVDVTLLVVAFGRTLRKDLRRATEILSLVRASIIGVALNEVATPSGRRNGYRYGGGKRYTVSNRVKAGDTSTGKSRRNQHSAHVVVNSNGNGNGRNGNGTGAPTATATAYERFRCQRFHSSQRTRTGC